MRRPGCTFFLTFVLIFIVVIPVFCFWLILENKSTARESKIATVEDAVLVRSLVKRSLKSIQSNKKWAKLNLTEKDLNSLIVFMARGINHSSGSAEVSPDGVRVGISLRVPDNPFGKYVNVRVGILPSDVKLKMSYIAVGRLRVPGAIALFVGPVLLDTILGEDLGTLAFSTIKTLQVREKQVTMKLKPLPDLKERIYRAKRRLKLVRDSVAHVGDPLVVRIYYAKLIEIDENLQGTDSISLAKYIGPLFQLAKERGGDPVEENQAAILALSTFLGSYRIGSFVGPIKTADMEEYKRKKRKVTLAGRVDLRLHFLISAGLNIITQSGITHAVGEFKELLDAGWEGGSGFSFADLAADRAGVHFAQMAVHGDKAKILQETFAQNVLEKDFFPPIDTLPEGISKFAFDNYYGNLESERYLSLVGAINNCIASSLPAYVPVNDTGILNQTLCNFSNVVPKKTSQEITIEKTESLKEKPKVLKKQSMVPKLVPKEKIIKQTPVTKKSQVENKGQTSDPPTLIAAKKEKFEEDKTLNVQSGITVPEENPEIKRLEVKLDGLLMRYTEKHPSVKALRRKLEFLKQKHKAGTI